MRLNSIVRSGARFLERTLNIGEYHLRKMTKFLGRVLREVPGFAADIAIDIPFMHIYKLYNKPKEIFGVLVAGPIVGFGSFILNRNSLILGALVAGFAACFPAMPLMTAVTIGLLANLGTGLTESIIARASNRKQLQKIHRRNTYQFNFHSGYSDNMGSGDSRRLKIETKQLIEQKFPLNQSPVELGPLAKAVYFDQYVANYLSISEKPYQQELLRNVAIHLGGLCHRHSKSTPSRRMSHV